MSDRIAIINQGVLEQIDEPRKIYEKPKTKFVAGFIGESNILDVVALEDMGDGVLKVGSEAGNGLVKTENYKSGDTFSISVRPEHMMFSKEPMEGFSLRGIVKDTIYVGNLIKMMVQLNNGDEIKINRFNAEDLAEIGDKVYLYWHLNKCVAVENQSRSIVDTDTVRDLGGDWNEAEK